MNIPDSSVIRRELLASAVKVSTRLANFLQEEYGMDEFLNANDDTITERFNTSVEFIYDEIQELGIAVADGIELNDFNIIRASIYLREYFDIAMFTKMLHESEQHYETLGNVLGSDAYAEGGLLEELIELFYDLTPIGSKIGHLNNNKHNFVNTDTFVNHIVALYDSVDNDINDDEDTLLEYTPQVIIHGNFVRSMMMKLTSHPDVNIKQSISLSTHDIDLLSMPNDQMIIYSVDDNHPILKQDDEPDTAYVKQHKLKFNHHFEYYGLNNDIIPTPEQIAILVTEYYVVGVYQEEYDSLMMKRCDVAGFKDDVKKLMSDYVLIMYTLFDN